jgi:cytochrome c oxidase subunit 3
MSTVHAGEAPPQILQQPLGMDQVRGRQGMLLFIGTEAALFVMLFFAYFFLAHNDWRWMSHPAPPLILPTGMTAIMIGSMLVLAWGKRSVARENFATARLAMGLTILFGLGWLAAEAFEFMHELATHSPRDDAYSSIFYTITTLHVCHEILGILMMGYVLVLPRVGRTDKPPHNAYRDVSLYWYFVAIVWFFVYFILYCVPNMR